MFAPAAAVVDELAAADRHQDLAAAVVGLAAVEPLAVDDLAALSTSRPGCRCSAPAVVLGPPR